jgi:DNA-binding HxlR family transcriptional regulator
VLPLIDRMSALCVKVTARLYRITPLGRTLDVPFSALNNWVARHANNVRAAQVTFDEKVSRSDAT